MVKSAIAEIVSKYTGLDKDVIINILAEPPNDNFGDLTIPCFGLAKQLRKSPNKISQDLTEQIPLEKGVFEKIEAKGPYLNFTLNKKWFLNSLLKDAMQTLENKIDLGKGERVIIEMSSPNIAKSFGIGHLRSTLIGNAISNIYTELGYDTIKINYLGDWGTQFGKLLYGFKRYGDINELKNNPIEHLHNIYVKTNLNLTDLVEDESRKMFKKLESGDAELLKLWTSFKELSLKEFNYIYDLLGVKFDVISGESEYNKKTDAIIEKLDGKKLIKQSEGATIVDLSNHNLGIEILKKQDGTTIYASRDLAAAIDRYEKYQFSKMIYEVGTEQQLHFKQVFKTLELLGYEWSDRLIHVDHGLYLGQDGKKLSTRQGKSINMMDIWNSVFDVQHKMYSEKSDLSKEEIDYRVTTLTRAAIIYADLKTYRKTDLVFDYEKMCSLHGNTGPYLLYSYARAASILNKVKNIDNKIITINEEPVQEEIKLAKHLATLGDTLNLAHKDNDPSKIADYAYNLAQNFNSFYQKCPVIHSDNTDHRIQLVKLYKQNLGKALEILGINTLESM
jgi:arginyl-tRNA synthetase